MKVKVLKIDNGGYFTSKDFREYLQKQGTKNKLTLPKIFKQNRVTEGMNYVTVYKSYFH